MRKVLLAAAALVCSALVGAAPANATAYGVQYWNAMTVDGVPVPGGQLAHLIEGDGYHVDTDGANYVSAGNLCDASVRFTYGNGATRIDGNVHSGCSHVGQWKYNVNRPRQRLRRAVGAQREANARPAVPLHLPVTAAERPRVASA